MLQLLYGVVFGEMVVILSFMFKTPLRKLVIVTLDRVKRGRGPVVVKTVGATLVVVLGSSVYSITKIQRRTLEPGIVNPTDQVLMSKHILEASLMGFVLFLSLMIDRLHHYIRELRLLRKTMDAAKKQSRSFEDGLKGGAEDPKVKKLESECEVKGGKIKVLEAELEALKMQCEMKGSKIKVSEAEVEALKKQSEGFLLEYDRLLAENQKLRSQLEGIGQSSSHLDNKKSL